MEKLGTGFGGRFLSSVLRVGFEIRDGNAKWGCLKKDGSKSENSAEWGLGTYTGDSSAINSVWGRNRRGVD